MILAYNKKRDSEFKSVLIGVANEQKKYVVKCDYWLQIVKKKEVEKIFRANKCDEKSISIFKKKSTFACMNGVK